MKMVIPQYNGKDNLVMVLTMPAFAIVVNSIILDASYYSNWKIFIVATILTAIAGTIDFILCGLVAVALKAHFPAEHQLMKRLSFMIITFLIISGLYLYSLFRGYEMITFFNYHFNQARFIWSYFSLGILNIFLTFLMEGISRYNDWLKNRQETEALNNAYKKSQLYGLKSQVNPHFLFNSLNSLSSLIQDDEEKAEAFLDEMSKVYRYMLRSDEEQMVTLETELSFVNSYIHILKARYGDGLQLRIQVSEKDKTTLLPALALQVIIENAFSQNIVSKSNPLIISIASTGQNFIEVSNNVQPKTITDAMDFDAGLDNLVQKYCLLNLPLTVMDTGNNLRIIQLPIMPKTGGIL